MTLHLMLGDMARSDVFTRVRASYLRGAHGVYLTSAKDGIAGDAVFEHLGRLMLDENT